MWLNWDVTASTSHTGYIFQKRYSRCLADKFTRRWEGVSLLTPEDSTSFSQFSG